MKPKLTRHLLFVRSNKGILLMIIFSIVCLTTSCQSSLTKEGSNKWHEHPPQFRGVKVYGKVDFLPHLGDDTPGPLHFTQNAVGIAWHKYPCSDSTSWSDITGGFIHLLKVGSNTYAMPITASQSRLANHPCITIFVEHIYPPTRKNHKTTKGYVRILAGPKKLGADFWTHFLPNSVDSIRIDFVVQDSAWVNGKKIYNFIKL